jgi:hypothetical protein
MMSQKSGEGKAQVYAEGGAKVSFSTTPSSKQGSGVSVGKSGCLSMQQNRYNFSLINCRTSSKA